MVHDVDDVYDFDDNDNDKDDDNNAIRAWWRDFSSYGPPLKPGDFHELDDFGVITILAPSM